VNVFPYLSPNIGEVSVVWQTREHQDLVLCFVVLL
jgi:hypothetical protein